MKATGVRHEIEQLRDFVARARVRLRPHGRARAQGQGRNGGQGDEKTPALHGLSD
jgi:hypothetical protein